MILRNCLLPGVILLLSHSHSFSQEIWTIGPMLHLNFGGTPKSTSFAIEAAYWNITRFYYGVDAGIEFDHGRIRVYSEAQTGVGLTGVALGPVVEFNPRKSKTLVGFQGSCWANYFQGVDYRLRLIDKKKIHAVGVYAKLPMATVGLDDGSHHTLNWDNWDEWD